MSRYYEALLEQLREQVRVRDKALELCWLDDPHGMTQAEWTEDILTCARIVLASTKPRP